MLAPGAVRACETCTPAHVVPAARWGTLQPWQGCVAAGGADCSILGDTTFYRFNYEPRCGIPAIRYPPFWFDLDAEGNLLFAATGSTLQIWDLSGDLDEPVADECQPVLGPWLKTDQDHYATSLDAPPGRSDTVVVGLEGGMGVSIFDTSDPANPVLKFQDEVAGTVWAVQATTINGQDYGIAVTDQQDVVLYNLQAARNLTTPCYEAELPRTCGVFMTRLQSGGQPLRSVRRVVAFGTFIAISTAGRPVVWDLAPFFATQPGDPRLVYSHPTQVSAFELWRQGSQLVLAIGTGQEVQIYDLPCVTTGTCTAATRITTLATPGAQVGAVRTATDTLEFSRDGNVSYLFAGSTVRRGAAPQREYIFDISSLATPEELTPKDHVDGYWGWYYEDGPTGVYSISPYTGVVNNGRLYRSGWSLLDVHEIQGSLPPVASFQPPALPIYVGDPVTFTDTSSRTPLTWKWWFDWDNQQGTPESTVRNPSWTFQAARAFKVRLEACNDSGCDTDEQTIEITSAVPVIGSVLANTTSIPQCGTVTFSASGVLGKPPLAYDWDAIDSGNNPTGASSTQTTFAWQVPQGQAAGNYRGRLQVSNGEGDATADSPVVAVTVLPPLSTPTVSAGTPNLGEVVFSSTGQGATEWRWNWGDGTAEFITTDPALGPNPIHNYTSTGTYTVRLTVSNCRDASRFAETTVTVTEVQQLLITTFQVQGVPECNPTLGCRVNANVLYTFRVVSSGSPTSFEFDWNGDNTFDETVTAPAPNAGVVTLNHPHTFTQSGVSVTPKVRARRGNQSIERAHIQIQVGNPVVPSVTVSGPVTLQLNQAGAFSAQATNCTPQPTTWSWTVSGGTISGSETAAAISVAWASTGGKTVRAQPTDGGCTNTSGQRSVTVTGTTGGGGTLAANFVVVTGNPTAGQPVTFNGSSSTGSPTAVLWQFGDGSQVGPAASPTAAHTYAQPGTYSVTLEVSKTDPACPQSLCVASKTSQITVGGTGGGPSDGDCVAGPETLCLRNNRFEVKVGWKNTTGGEGNAKVAPPTTGDSGIFYFFNPNNWEMLIKVLDGCTINDAFWVFAASSTDLGLSIKVTDSKSDQSMTYTTTPGQPAPAITDTSALAVCED